MREPPPGDSAGEPRTGAESGKADSEGPRTREGKKTEKAKARADKAGEKLGKAHAKLDAQKPPKEPVFPAGWLEAPHRGMDLRS